MDIVKGRDIFERGGASNYTGVGEGGGGSFNIDLGRISGE